MGLRTTVRGAASLGRSLSTNRKTFALAFEFYGTLSTASFCDCVEMVFHFHLVSQEVGAQELCSGIGHRGNDRRISLLSVRVTHGQGKLSASGCDCCGHAQDKC
jgi:hypothetical protein